MRHRRALIAVILAAASVIAAAATPLPQTIPADGYRLQPASQTLLQAFTEEQVAVLEKLNRADRDHLQRLATIVLPVTWRDDETAYSPFPIRYESASPLAKALVVRLDVQAFGAYEYGTLVRWGPVSTGARGRET